MITLLATLLLATPAAHAADGWRLVGAYDAAAVVAAVEADRDEDEVEAEASVPPFTWAPNPVLADYCGHPRAPTGLGVMESVAIHSGLSPTLLLVLRSDERSPAPLREDDVAVSLVRSADSTDVSESVVLQPAVEPRRLRVSLQDQTRSRGDGRDDSWVQVVRTQLGIQLCLEHMLGRAWSGGDENRVRQAFLLERPRPSNDGDRRYLVGQRDPVAAYLGPPDACEVRGAASPRSAEEASAELVPADVWEGRLRPCSAAGGALPEATALPIQLSGSPDQERRTQRGWSEMAIVLRDGSTTVPTVEVLLDGASLGAPTLLMSQDESKGASSLAGRMEDLLGRVPLHYPMIRQGGDWYTVLMIPEWQLAEALHRRAAMIKEPAHTMQRPAPRRPAIDTLAVSWILSHPELLRVQVRPRDTGAQEGAWPDLAVAMQRGLLGERDWGYTVGMAAGRASIALPTAEPVEWDHALLAQRGEQQSAMMAAAAALFLAFLVGLRRVAELWRPVPEERADYWPAVGKDGQEDNTPDGPSGMISTEGVE